MPVNFSKSDRLVLYNLDGPVSQQFVKQSRNLIEICEHGHKMFPFVL